MSDAAAAGGGGAPSQRPFAPATPASVLAAALLLIASTPPAWFPGAPLLVVPGLALQFVVARRPGRALLASYLLGVVHLGGFSWSVHHTNVVVWLAVALFGGLYYALVAAAVRGVAARWQPLAFAVAVAGASWLRAEVPEIPYPHGQAAHALWQWPALLGAVRLGGEPLLNALLAGLGAALVVAVRTRRPAPLLWAAVPAVVLSLPWPVGPAAAGPTVAVAAIEPGINPIDETAGATTRAEYDQLRVQLVRDRLLAPTRELARQARAGDRRLDLVLWPESSVPVSVLQRAAGPPEFVWLERAVELPAGARLLLGSDLEWPDEPVPEDQRALLTPVAVLVDERGRFLGVHEKQRLVPGGERIPFLPLLPGFVEAALREAIHSMGAATFVVPGRARPPLQTAAGVPFAALICYDNAFPGPFAAAAADGARFVAVISNESWFRTGGELVQLAAITVLRAIAYAMPVVRCTTDGMSMAVDQNGRILAALPLRPPRAPGAPTPPPRILRVDLPTGPGALPPLAPVHPILGWTLALLLVAAALRRSLRRPLVWARLSRPDRPLADGAGSRTRPDAPKGGS